MIFVWVLIKEKIKAHAEENNVPCEVFNNKALRKKYWWIDKNTFLYLPLSNAKVRF
jgi:hypothetical protein